MALASGQPGKEILYPVATVILGGLFSSTLLDFFVRPALFWTFGQKATKRAMKLHLHEPDLSDTQSPAPYHGHVANFHKKGDNVIVKFHASGKPHL
ncbi:MAG: hypothetical protein ABSA77_11450 [Thermoguttaceae bacterium]|jgi:HME family heavy-metal exporter